MASISFAGRLALAAVLSLAPAAVSAQMAHGHTHDHASAHAHAHAHADAGHLHVTPHASDAYRTVAAIDRRLADLDVEIGRLDREIGAVRAEFRTMGDGSADRAAYDERVAAFEADRRRFEMENGRVRAMHDDLVRYGGNARARRAYADAVQALRYSSARLEADADALRDWNRSLTSDTYAHTAHARAVAERGQGLSQRRSDLRHEREILRLRRARLAARARS